MQYNLNIQYQLTPSLTSLVAYVGSRGIHQPYRPDDADIVIPTLTSAGYLFPKVDALGNLFRRHVISWIPTAVTAASCAPPSRINENYGSVRGMFYEGQSYYNALETQLAKRMSHGFQVQGTFTWGRSIDTSSATLAGDAFGNSIASPSYFFNPRVSRGSIRLQRIAHAGDQRTLGTTFAEIHYRAGALFDGRLATGDYIYGQHGHTVHAHVRYRQRPDRDIEFRRLGISEPSRRCRLPVPNKSREPQHLHQDAMLCRSCCAESGIL